MLRTRTITVGMWSCWCSSRDSLVAYVRVTRIVGVWSATPGRGVRNNEVMDLFFRKPLLHSDGFAVAAFGGEVVIVIEGVGETPVIHRSVGMGESGCLLAQRSWLLGACLSNTVDQ